ncbi:metallophosphoesterase [Levilactobacillus suantsaii]|uniref:Phosphoesterase n=1 Tax=Levilactobacillus suantsaii TaxID=2292255 RepID=A0A4V1LF52_9LACO|nr:metallophosphoesterase [Levilactobacillus suantsaii]QMU07042.1 metallophosphoesterase [Levilactobacillus suantsaii]RXI76515.1 phosphoesterase [Levilactobacillus suantsaii]
MVRVALISDLHFDVNRVDPAQIITQQVAYLKRQRVGLYLIAGDLSNHFDQSVRIAQALQTQLAPAQVRFIAGNHDMLHDVSAAALETPLTPTYLHNQFLDVAGTNWRIIGNNGWYDYGFADNLVGRNFQAWKNAFWVDSSIPQDLSDPQRFERVYGQLTAQLAQAQAAQKQVLVMTHFVPRREYIVYTQDNRFWNMANAVMGSPRLGQLFAQYQVPVVVFGHMHRHYWPQHLSNTWYYNQALGYHNHRLNEWESGDFMTEWRRRLRILTLT